MNNSDKIILDLCGGTGAWSKPYKEAGYTVINVTLPEYDITNAATINYCIGLNPYGILFAAPCDIWSNAGVRFWKLRTSDQVLYHAKLLISGLRIIHNANPVFWCLENPVGKMKDLIGEPVYKFHPYYFGDAYTKKTYLWGKFNIPAENRVEPIWRNPVKNGGGNSFKSKQQTPVSWLSGKNRKEKRAITPPEFAKAFMEANQ